MRRIGVLVAHCAAVDGSSVDDLTSGDKIRRMTACKRLCEQYPWRGFGPGYVAPSLADLHSPGTVHKLLRGLVPMIQSKDAAEVTTAGITGLQLLMAHSRYDNEEDSIASFNLGETTGVHDALVSTLKHWLDRTETEGAAAVACLSAVSWWGCLSFYHPSKFTPHLPNKGSSQLVKLGYSMYSLCADFCGESEQKFSLLMHHTMAVILDHDADPIFRLCHVQCFNACVIKAAGDVKVRHVGIIEQLVSAILRGHSAQEMAQILLRGIDRNTQLQPLCAMFAALLGFVNGACAHKPVRVAIIESGVASLWYEVLCLFAEQEAQELPTSPQLMQVLVPLREVVINKDRATQKALIDLGFDSLLLKLCQSHFMLGNGTTVATQAAILSALLLGREEVKEQGIGLDIGAVAGILKTLEDRLTDHWGSMEVGPTLIYLTGIAEIAASGSYRTMLVEGGAIRVLKILLMKNRDLMHVDKIDAMLLATLEHFALDSETMGHLSGDEELLGMVEALKT